MKLMGIKRLAAAGGLAILATTTLAACGDGGRPSVDEVSAALQKGDDAITEEKVADCMAKVFVDSDLSDETLRKAVEDENMTDEDVPKEDQKVVESEEFLTGLMDCAKESKEYQDMEQEMSELEDSMGDMPEVPEPTN